ncbi:T9SS type A sorting domain-containing protein [Flavobacterium sp.]
MKKLLLALFISSTSFVGAQVLQSENFETMTVGNVGTDLTGVTPGQNGWYTGNATGGTNGNNSNYQVVAVGGTQGNALQITGSNAATGTRFMWKDGMVDAWAGRTAGNDIIEVEFDFNPLAASTSLNGFRVYIYSDETTAKVLAGMGVATNATVSAVSYANVVQGFAYWTSTPGTGTYSFGLGPNATTPAVLMPSEWVRLGFSFNNATGEVKWKGPDIDAAFTGTTPFPVVTVGLNPGEVDFLGTTGTGNTVADSSMFDNLVVRASATDTLLGTETISRANAFSAYPNPTKDFVTVSSYDYSVNTIQITDINGRTVKTMTNDSNNAQVDLSGLSQGVYMMKISSNDGVSTTKKIIKQ